MPPPTRPDPAAPSPAAALVALADRCVQCGLCLPHCPTYRLDRSEAESPRGRIAYTRAVARGDIPPTPAGDAHLDHCLGCRRCEAACPAGVRYGELLVVARGEQARRRRPPARVRAALALLARPRLLDALAGLQRRFGRWWPRAWQPALPPPPAAVPMPAAPAAPTGRVALFTGCIARAHESPARAALARLLGAAGIAVEVPGGQGCCGTAAAHAGDTSGAAALAAANQRAFAGAGTVLCLASGCQDALARSLEGIAATEDAILAVERIADRLAFRPATGRIALHLPCSQRAVVRSDAALRRLLARIPQLDLVELPDTGCCGAAGLHQLAEPGRAAALRAPLLDALAASGAARLLSSNIGCRLHLAGGTTIPVQHPIEFLAEHLS